MKNRAKSALALALAIVGWIAAGMRCDASEWVETSSQYNPHPAQHIQLKHIQKGLPLLSHSEPPKVVFTTNTRLLRSQR